MTTHRRTFTPGQQLTFIQAHGTQYQKPAIVVKYVEPYAHGFDEHVVFYPDGVKVAILDRDIFA